MKTPQTSPTTTTELNAVPLFALIVNVRAYEQAARHAYKDILTSRPDVFGEAHRHYGELVWCIETAPQARPDDAYEEEAHYEAYYSIMERLKASRKRLAAAIIGITDAPTRRRKAALIDAVEDALADINEARAIRIEARHPKAYPDDVDADRLTAAVTGTCRKALIADANEDDGKVNDIIMLLTDIRRTFNDALIDARPRRADVAAIMTAVNIMEGYAED